MYKTLLHVIFAYCDEDGEQHRCDVFKEVMLPVAPVVGFRFCPDSKHMCQCDEWEVEEVIYDVDAGAFIAVSRQMDCDETSVDIYSEVFAHLGWATTNPLGY